MNLRKTFLLSAAAIAALTTLPGCGGGGTPTPNYSKDAYNNFNMQDKTGQSFRAYLVKQIKIYLKAKLPAGSAAASAVDNSNFADLGASEDNKTASANGVYTSAETIASPDTLAFFVSTRAENGYRFQVNLKAAEVVGLLQYVPSTSGITVYAFASDTLAQQAIQGGVSLIPGATPGLWTGESAKNITSIGAQWAKSWANVADTTPVEVITNLFNGGDFNGLIDKLNTDTGNNFGKVRLVGDDYKNTPTGNFYVDNFSDPTGKNVVVYFRNTAYAYPIMDAVGLVFTKADGSDKFAFTGSKTVHWTYGVDGVAPSSDTTTLAWQTKIQNTYLTRSRSLNPAANVPVAQVPNM